MKRIISSIVACTAVFEFTAFADDVYTNQKTVSAAEEITGNLYVGHDAAEAAEPAALTVENGGSLTVREISSYLLCGTNSLLIRIHIIGKSRKREYRRTSDD